MHEPPHADVSLVCTVRNEAGSIEDLMRSIAAQTLRPREVIVVDGGSRDGTQLHIEWWHGRLGCPLRLIERAGANISAGRNVGIAAARFPIIAVTDAGVRLDPHWLARLMEPFDDPAVSVCGGFFVADAHTTFEAAMGATVLPDREEIDGSSFLPSSRSVAFRTCAWESVGGYPEWLDYCEDVVFDLALRERHATFAFAPDALARFRPRGTLRAYWHQYFRYARGDGAAGLWPKRHAVRYATYGSLIALIAAGKKGRAAWPFVALGAALYLRKPYRRLLPKFDVLQGPQRATAILLVPIIRAVGDIAKMCGYPVGITRRLRHHGVGWTWRAALSPRQCALDRSRNGPHP
jgi:glycosyltransferase involved in cell wall biosynthesis